MLRLEWNIDDVRVLVEAIAAEAEDEELDDRLRAVDTTLEKYSRKKPVSGEECLVELLGEVAVKNIHEWAAPSNVLKRHCNTCWRKAGTKST